MERWVRRSVAIGAVVAVVGAAAVWVLASARDGFRAQAQLVVLPAADLDPDVASSYFETLSRGQIVGTFAELMTHTAVDGAQVEVVPDTAVLAVHATADDGAAAERRVAETLDAGMAAVAALDTPYELRVTTWPDGTAASGALPTWQVAVAAVVVAVVAGLATQQAVLYLAGAITPGTPVAAEG